MIALLRALLGRGGERISPREALARMERGACLVDVRESHEYAARHAPGAVHVPLARIRECGPASLAALPADAQVLLVCQAGMRSRLAQASLAAAGRPCADVDGGMAAWAGSGLPTVTGNLP